MPTTPAGALALLRMIAENLEELPDAKASVSEAILGAVAIIEREARS